MTMRKDAAEHRRQILQTAQNLFSTYGVDGVSMHQIARAAGIGQGTLYRNYTNKADLCLDMMHECSRLLDQELNRIIADPQASVQFKLELLLSHILGFIEEKSQWLGAVQTPTCQEGRSTYYRSPIYESAHRKIRQLLDEAVLRKECTIELDTVIAADTILAAADPDLYLFLRRGRGYSPDDIMRNLQNLYLHPLFTTKG
jgi:AcrR family transcriptional regulator